MALAFLGEALTRATDKRHGDPFLWLILSTGHGGFSWTRCGLARTVQWDVEKMIESKVFRIE